MNIRHASEEADLVACYPVMHALRPRLDLEDFIARVRRQQAGGYRLAMLEADGQVVTVAGYRLGDNLAWGRFLYVDDLVTLESARSRGHGTRMLAWLRAEARREGCVQLHLDSGVQREDAHRFYLREGLQMTSLHFAERLD
ncbi:GNAT family N-acetyltransferase [Thioalkalivibrio sulfidiphilus]|uniref:GNAT family N-acetyltransferase n=1 Tax=Thioalkalivibrio sulfidiphilus TaxID=1033854 RepID=UPI000363789C|nr:GNAT family N-acetyltransferase [Thioalkalivibrio sulfidiphilus]